MALWMGCVLHKPELFKQFIYWKNTKESSAIKCTADFVIVGILECPEEKIRMDFQNTFGALAKHFSTGDNSALVFLLGLLAKNFPNISDKPARQFFDLFDELIDLNEELNWQKEE